MLNATIRPARLLRYDSVIRLTLFTQTVNAGANERSTADIARFVAAWQSAADASPRQGVVYRELCVQREDWTRLAAAEMDNPIEATFLEYLIVEGGTDLSRLPALPATETAHFQITWQDIHNVAFHFVKDQSDEKPGALMFNLFEVDGPPGMEQGFLMDWPPRGAFKIREDGIMTTVLHQRMLPRTTVKAFNRVECRSAEQYAEGIARFEAAFPRAARKAAAGPSAANAKPPIRSHLGLFEIVALGPAGDSRPSESMKAVTYNAYGGPDVLTISETRRPEPGPGQIRVKVRASSINPLDIRMRSGDVADIYPHWFPDVIGYSVSGVIDAVGEGVTERSVGEEVYGINNPIMRHGYAEYVVSPAGNFYPKPRFMDFDVAAAAPSIFATAYGGLFLRANLQAGQTVLIHGAAGMIGSCAVQLAKQAGAHVIGTASAKNLAHVRKLGAEVVVDYHTQRFEDFAKDVDLVFDTVGGETQSRSWPLLRKGGTLATLLPPEPDQAIAQRYGVQAFMVHGHPNIGEIMPEMTRRLEEGELESPEIAATFPLAQAAQAHAEFERSAPHGRIVLVVDETSYVRASD